MCTHYAPLHEPHIIPANTEEGLFFLPGTEFGTM